jgi:hypothetical protein
MSVTSVKILPQNSKPFGLTFNEWSIKWWQWLLAIPKSTNPALDYIGKYASIGQVHPNIFFLCQTMEGIRQQPTRKISIHRGTSIFMPIINWISNFYEHGNTEKELVEIAREKMDSVGNLELNLDGINIQGLEKYRFLSNFFTVKLPKDNILDLPSGNARLISDGFWVLTEPIITDTAIITFGSCSSGVTKIGVKYAIKVI